jgi:voltage-gated potassium channel
VLNSNKVCFLYNILATFWWAVATLTAIGYGDVYPVTDLGRLLSGVIAVPGICLVALPTGLIGSGFIEEISKKKRQH